MPYFSDYQEVDVEMNIDVDEFYEEMDHSERQEMYELLVKNGLVLVQIPHQAVQVGNLMKLWVS